MDREVDWRRWLVAGVALAGLSGLAGCGTTNAPAGATVAAGTPSPSAVAGANGQWVQLSVGKGPLPRNSGGFAYDDHTGGMLLSGGKHSCGPAATDYVDTWSLRGSSWQQQHPKNDGPGYMASFVMADDPASHQVVALGVFSGCGVVTGMFTWSGTDWLAAPQGMTLPDPSFSYTLTYDDATHQLLAVGAAQSNTIPKPYEVTWTWDGQKWTQQHPAQSLPLLADAAAAYDPASRRVILFGGAGFDKTGNAGSSAVADTWAWDGTNWTQLHPATSPSPRRGAAMASTGDGSGPILFGGISSAYDKPGATVYGDTWSWSNNTWVQLHPATSPTPRFLTQMAYDAGRQQIVLFGGALNGSADSDDVWVYRSR